MTFPFGIKNLEALYKNSESGNGGFFPLGKGVLWHSGIHINATNKEKISPILCGKVILYRLSKEYKKTSLTKFISREHFCSNESYYSEFYKQTEKDNELYELNDSNAKESISDCFILLKHELNIDTLNPNKFIFYTLYTNLEPDTESTIYKKTKLKVDGMVHYLTDNESFFTDTIGIPGLNKNQRYFDYVLILEKDITTYTFDKSKTKDLFLGIKSGTALYERQLATPLDFIPNEELFIPNHTHFEITEYSKDEQNLSKYISLKSLRIYLKPNGGLKGDKFQEGKSYILQDYSQIWFSSGVSINFTNEKSLLPKKIAIFI